MVQNKNPIERSQIRIGTKDSQSQAFGQSGQNLLWKNYDEVRKEQKQSKEKEMIEGPKKGTTMFTPDNKIKIMRRQSS